MVIPFVAAVDALPFGIALRIADGLVFNEVFAVSFHFEKLNTRFHPPLRPTEISQTCPFARTHTEFADCASGLDAMNLRHPISAD
jgi:hypothetical protein